MEASVGSNKSVVERNTFGVELRQATEMKESTANKRQVKYKFTCRGFVFRGVSAVENGVITTTFPWTDPKGIGIEDHEDRVKIEAKVNAEVQEYVAALED